MKKMKFNKLFLIALLGLSMLFNTSCRHRVDAGYVGVKVYLLGQSKGVNQEVLGVGKYWIGINEDLYLFPTYQVNYVFTKDTNEGSPTNEEFTFQTKEGMECSMDLGIAMHFNPDDISQMFQTYHKGENEIRGVVVRNSMRDALNKVAGLMQIESVYGEGKSKLIDSVKQIVKKQLDSTGIVVDNVYLIGSIRIPAGVKQALDDKVKMTQEAQKAENELQKATAMAKIKIVNAEAEAQANKILVSSINQTLVEWETIKKWNGVLPTVTGGNSLIQIPMK
jgi:regulator of protease activity HflC (stomatin/prohibitin superfamily)